MKIEHKPFKGANYEYGINGKKIAVVGYSFWHNGEYPDTEDWGAFTLSKVMSGAWKPRFFSTIRNSFGFGSHAEFWERVLFFNYVSTMIGNGAERFAAATDEEARAANIRFERIIDEHKPDLVLVFTKKTQLGALGLGFKPLPEPLQMFVHAERTSGGHTARIIRLRHPQGANGAALKKAVAQTVGLPLPL
jgi:hypothetical protein